MRILGMKAAATALLLAGLTGCMALPSQREGKLDTHAACVARCNRDSQVCGDTKAGQSDRTPELNNGMCQRDLKSCLNRCGDPG
ncbi:hypothetical protein VPG91_23650 [Nitrospirillum amazonense]|uniref:hypothetical protein n=1 Tax=Nitrospirillum amazonense TaxID=28077 RepID=UPI002DD42664|nr:hypothetical protein [Nitrospirillum amazonense]MEC4594015.1 hypothetical protein [Nitrospirillum amazonense]